MHFFGIVKLKIFHILFLIVYVESGLASGQSLFLVAGQSNAAGVGDFHVSAKCPPHSSFEYKMTMDNFIPLADPVGEDGYGFDAASSGSAWPAFATRYYELSREPVYIIPAAKGGSSLNPHFFEYLRWDSLGHLFAAAVDKGKRAAARINLPLDGVIWSQGEADAGFINAGKSSAAQYKSNLKSLIQLFRQEFDDRLPFYIIQTGYSADENTAGYEAVQKVQEEICNELPSTYLVYPFTKLFPEFNLMEDYVHYSQEGYNLIGKTVAEMIFDIQTNKIYNNLLSRNTAIFPNPSEGTLTITMVNILLREQATLTVFNSVGTVVEQFNLALKQTTIEELTVQLYDLFDGFYYLRLQLGDYSYVQKVVKASSTNLLR